MSAILVLVLYVSAAHGLGLEPEFAGPVANVTVPLGRDALFVCTVNHLGGHKVGWVKADTKAIQAIHLTVVTHNPRVQVDHSGQSVWKLIIRNVHKEDSGAYMCQINTDPMKSQVSYLEVTEPPDILDELTPSEERVLENSPLKLSCKARGHPQPKITWKREDGRDLALNSKEESQHNKHHRHRGNRSVASVPTFLSSFEGEVLRFSQVTRYHMATYLCIANNGVPPSVSKRINVVVLFAPWVMVANQLVGAPMGTDVTVECIIESSPPSVNIWTKEGSILVPNNRYTIDEIRQSPYQVRMVLTIRQFQPSDSGRIHCHARNSLGEAEESIRLYELPAPPRETVTISWGGSETVSGWTEASTGLVSWGGDPSVPAENIHRNGANDNGLLVSASPTMGQKQERSSQVAIKVDTSNCSITPSAIRLSTLWPLLFLWIRPFI